MLDGGAFPAVDATSSAVGGRLCLALVNSVWWRRGPAPEEHLTELADLVTLAACSGWLPNAVDVLRLAAEKPRAAAAALARAVELREHLLAVFAATAAGAAAPDVSLRAIEKVGARGLAELRLAGYDDGSYRLRWPQPTLDLPAQQAATSALLLLASPHLDRVKQCPGPTCGWVFLDSTRNRSRRWCDSRECGNRSRVQAHYQRTRVSDPAGVAAPGVPPHG